MTCCDFIKSYRKKQGEHPPYPVFVFRTTAGPVCGEYDPQLGDDAWTGDTDILDKEVAYWFVSWDQQDVDAVMFWITIKGVDKITPDARGAG